MTKNQNNSVLEDDVNLQEALISAVSDTLEGMAFIEVLKADTITPYDEHMARLRVAILINSPFPGEICMVLPVALASLFVQNMYSIEEQDLTDSIKNDVLGEILNVVAGCLMSRIMPVDQSYQLGLPEIGNDVFLQTELNAKSIEFNAEGYPFWILLVGDTFEKGKIEQ